MPAKDRLGDTLEEQGFVEVEYKTVRVATGSEKR